MWTSHSRKPGDISTAPPQTLVSSWQYEWHCCLRLNDYIGNVKAVAGETEGLSPWPRRWSLTALTSVATKPTRKRTPVSVKNVADKANKSWIFSSISKARIFLMVRTMDGEVHVTLPHDGVAAVENSVEVPPKIKNGPTL